MNQSQFQESIDTFKVKFAGSNSIDAELFARTINNTIELVKASAKAINPDSFLRLEIKANKEGSFETIIDAVVKYGNPCLFIGANLAKEIVNGYLSFLQIKQLLGNTNPQNIIQEGSYTTITNHQNTSTTVKTEIYNQYICNGNIEHIIINQSNDLKNSSRPMIIETQDKNIIFTEEDYKNMSKPKEEVTTDKLGQKNSNTIKECELLIKKADLRGFSKWEVFFLDKIIPIKIDDKDFLQQIRDGKIKISGGSRLVCDLNIQSEIDDEYNVTNVEYTVLKVHRIKDDDEQLNLFSSDV